MNKCVKFVPIISLFLVSGSAFAQSGSGVSALESAVALGAMQGFQAADVPAPSMEKVAAHKVQLVDITDKSTKDGEVVSAYPVIYKMIEKQENSRIIKVFGFTDAKGAERRIEVLFTGGDWMQYGLTYLATNAGQDNGRVRAYFMNDLSTPDHEDGGIAPKVDPFNSEKLADFITSEFLDANGGVKTVFGSVAEAAAAAN